MRFFILSLVFATAQAGLQVAIEQADLYSRQNPHATRPNQGWYWEDDQASTGAQSAAWSLVPVTTGGRVETLMGNNNRVFAVLKPGPGASLTGQYVCDGWGGGSQFLATKFGAYLNFKRFQVDVQPYDGGGWGVVFNYVRKAGTPSATYTAAGNPVTAYYLVFRNAPTEICWSAYRVVGSAPTVMARSSGAVNATNGFQIGRPSTLTVIKSGATMSFTLVAAALGGGLIPSVTISGSWVDTTPGGPLPEGNLGLFVNGAALIAFDNVMVIDDFSCTDGLLNGDEEGIDCGGSTCSACTYPVSYTHNWAQRGISGWLQQNMGVTGDTGRYFVENDGNLWQRTNHGTDLTSGTQCINMWQGHSVLNTNWGKVYDFELSVTMFAIDNDGTGLYFRYQDMDNFYVYTANNEDCCVSIRRRRGGVDTMLPHTHMPAGFMFGYYTAPATLTGYRANGLVNRNFPSCAGTFPGQGYLLGGVPNDLKLVAKGNLFQLWRNGVLVIEVMDTEDGAGMGPGLVGMYGQRTSGQGWANPTIVINSRTPTAPGWGLPGSRSTLPIRSFASALPLNVSTDAAAMSSLRVTKALGRSFNPTGFPEMAAPLVMHLDSSTLLPRTGLTWWGDSSGVGNNAFAYAYNAAQSPPSVTVSPNEPAAVTFAGNSFLSVVPTRELNPLYKGLSVVVAFKASTATSAYILSLGKFLPPQVDNRPGYSLIINPTTPLTASVRVSGVRRLTPLSELSYGVPLPTVQGTFNVDLNRITVIGFRISAAIFDPLYTNSTDSEPIYNVSLWMPSRLRTSLNANSITWLNSNSTGINSSQTLFSYAPISVEGGQSWFNLGADESGVTNRFTGNVYEVAVFSGALSDREMQAAVDHVGSEFGSQGCPAINATLSGAAFVSGNCLNAVPGSVCNLQCPTGSRAVGGISSLACLDSGVWSSPNPLTCLAQCSPFIPENAGKTCKYGPVFDFSQSGALGPSSSVQRYRMFNPTPFFGAPMWIAENGKLYVTSHAGSSSVATSRGAPSSILITSLTSLRLAPGNIIDNSAGGVSIGVTITQTSGTESSSVIIRFREADNLNHYFVDHNAFINKIAFGRTVNGIQTLFTCVNALQPNISIGSTVKLEVLSQGGAISSEFPVGSLILLANGITYCNVVDSTFLSGTASIHVTGFTDAILDDLSFQVLDRACAATGCSNMYAGSSCSTSCAAGFLPVSPPLVTCDQVNNTAVLSSSFRCAPEPPRFFNQTFRVKELVAAGTSVAVINATLASPTQTILFRIIGGNDGNTFAVDPCSGLITVNNPLLLDFENVAPGKNAFNLVISAAVVGFEASVFTISGVTINIDDADDPATLLPATISVAENAVVGNSVGQIFAFDPEGDPVTLSIESGNLNGVFGISATIPSGTPKTFVATITIAKSGVLDFETQSTVRILIKCTNPSLPSSFSQSIVAITIVNANDLPVISIPIGLTYLAYEIPSTGIALNGQIGAPLIATDQDAGDTQSWSYTISSGSDLAIVNSQGLVLSRGIGSYTPGSEFVKDSRIVFAFEEILVRVTDSFGGSAEASLRIYQLAASSATGAIATQMSIIIADSNEGSGSLPSGSGSFTHTIGTSGGDIIEFFTETLQYRESTHNIVMNVTSSTTQIGWTTTCLWSGQRSTASSGPLSGQQVIDSVRCPTQGAWGTGYVIVLSQVQRSNGAMTPIIPGVFLGFSYAPPKIAGLIGVTGGVSSAATDVANLETTGGERIRIQGFGFGPATAYNFVTKASMGRPLQITYGAVGIYQYAVSSFSGSSTEIEFSTVPGVGKEFEIKVSLGGQSAIGGSLITLSYALSNVISVTAWNAARTAVVSRYALDPLGKVNVLEVSGSNFGPFESQVDKQPILYFGSADEVMPLRFSTVCNQAPAAMSHTKLFCEVPAGLGKNLTFVVKTGGRVGGRDGNRSPPNVEVSYSPPVVTVVTGAGSVKGDTRGGLVIYVEGNFGPAALSQGSDAPKVSYGPVSNPLRFSAMDCAMKSTGTGGLGRIECLTGPGAGANLVVRAYVGQQWGPPGGSLSYAPPTLNSFETDKAVSPGTDDANTVGNENVVIYGTNFGPDTIVASATYAVELESGNVSSPIKTITFSSAGCIKPSGVNAHSQLTCLTSAGAGKSLNWEIIVEGQMSSNPVTSYASPVIDKVTLADGVTAATNLPTNGGTVLLVQGKGFGPATSPGPLVSRVFFGASSVLDGISGLAYTPSSVNVLSDSTVRIVTAPGIGQGLLVRSVVADVFSQPSPSSTGSISFQLPSVGSISPQTSPTLPSNDIPGGDNLVVKGSGLGLLDLTASQAIYLDDILLPFVERYPSVARVLSGNLSAAELNPNNHFISALIPEGVGQQLAVKVVVFRTERPSFTSSSIPATDGASTWFSYTAPQISSYSVNTITGTSAESIAAQNKSIDVFGAAVSFGEVRLVVLRGTNFGPLSAFTGAKAFVEIQNVDSNGVALSGSTYSRANIGVISWTHNEIKFVTRNTAGNLRVAIPGKTPAGAILPDLTSNVVLFFDISPTVNGIVGMSPTGYDTIGGDIITIEVGNLLSANSVTIKVGNNTCTNVLNDQGVVLTTAQYKTQVIDAQLAAKPANVPASEFLWTLKCKLPPGQGSNNAIIVYRDTIPGSSTGVSIRYRSPAVQTIELQIGSPVSPSYTLVSEPVLISTEGAIIRLTGNNLGTCPVVIFGLNRGALCPENKLPSDTIIMSYPSFPATHSVLLLTLPSGWGSGRIEPGNGGKPYAVLLIASDQQTSASIQYASPVITQVRPKIFNDILPTIGGNEIKITGSNFGSLSAPVPVITIEMSGFSGAITSAPCTNVYRDTTPTLTHFTLYCTLPPGSGSNSAIRVAVSDLVTVTQNVIAYALPSITSALSFSQSAWKALFTPAQLATNVTFAAASTSYLSTRNDSAIALAIPTATFIKSPVASMPLLSGSTTGDDVIVLTGNNFGVRDSDAHCVLLSWTFRSTDSTRVPSCNGLENYLGEGEVDAARIIYWTHTRIAFTIPPGLGTKDIELTIRGSLLSMTNSRNSPLMIRFRYSIPVVTSFCIGSSCFPKITAPLASTEGGETGEITGLNFGPAPFYSVSNNTYVSDVFLPGIPLSLASSLPTAAIVVTQHRACSTNAFLLSGLRSTVSFKSLSNTLKLDQCALLSYSDQNRITFESQAGIGANRLVQIIVVEDADKFPDALLYLPASIQAVPKVSQYSSADITFSYYPPTIQIYNPSTVFLAPKKNVDESTSPATITFDTASIEISGSNFGNEELAVVQGWTNEERAISGSVGGIDCKTTKRSRSNGVTLLTLEVFSEKVPVGHRNVTIFVAGQKGVGSDRVVVLPGITAGITSVFTPLLLVCKEGYYAKLNETCLPCPAQYPEEPQLTGARCEGYVPKAAKFEDRFKYPIANKGWYNFNSSDANTLKWGAPGESQMSACPEDGPIDTGRSSGRDLCIAPCEPAEACIGNNLCAFGYASKPPSWGCSSCDTGFYKRAGSCVKCPDSPWALVIGFTLLVVAMGVLGFFLNSKGVNIAVISIGIDFFQVLAIFATSGVKWPPAVKELLHILSAFNLNIEIVAPECIVPDLSYKAKFWFIMLLPLSVGSLFLAIFASMAAYKAFIQGAAKKTWFTHKAALLATTMSLMYILYLYLTRTVFDVFNCTPTMPPDGYLHLSVASGERCGVPGGTQLTLLPSAIAGLVIYSFGYPTFIAYMLYMNRELCVLDQLLRAKGTGNDRLSNPMAFDVRTGLGRQYFQFKPDFFMWILAIILRKFFIAITAVVFSKNSSFQMAACLMIMFLAYSAQMMFRPYMSPGEFDVVIKQHEESVFTSAIHARCKMQLSHVESRGRKKTRRNLMNFEGKIDQSAVLGVLTGWLFNYNTIEQVMLFSAVIVCLMGIMYQANATSSFYPGALDGVTGVVMITIIGAILYYVTVLVTEMVILYNEDSSKARLLKKSMSKKEKKDKSSRLTVSGDSQQSALIDVASDLTMNPLFLNEGGKAGSTPGSPTASPTPTVPVDVVMSYSKPPPQELWTIIQGEFAAMSNQLAAARKETQILPPPPPPLEKSDDDIKGKKKNQFSPLLANT